MTQPDAARKQTANQIACSLIASYLIPALLDEVFPDLDDYTPNEAANIRAKLEQIRLELTCRSGVRPVRSVEPNRVVGHVSIEQVGLQYGVRS